MNDHKFAFILCTNNELYLQECLSYIDLLVLPDGYEVDILTIQDAPNIASGYNDGMTSTDAKYKIYMHQDVFIINPYFFSDILTIFQSDPTIGMIGMIGYPRISPNGVMWHEIWEGCKLLYGKKNIYPNATPASYRYSFSEDGISEVALLDGLMMITSQDLPWDNEILQGWHFYDAFQSMQYLLQGYRIVVPNQRLPWTIHDDGQIASMWDYNKYRKLFMQKYAEYLGKMYHEIRK